MKNVFILLCAATVLAVTYGFIIPKTSEDILDENVVALASEEGELSHKITCNDEICIIENAKNRFLASGCKSKKDFWCKTQKTDLSDFGFDIL